MAPHATPPKTPSLIVKTASIFLLLAFTLFTTGCGKSHPTMYYAFSSEPWDLIQDSLPPTTLRIARIAVPQYLDRDSVVQRKGVALTVNSLSLWAEPLSDGIRRLMLQDLTKPLLKNSITVLPLASQDNGRFTLLIDIVHLDGRVHEDASLTAQWSLLESENNRMLESGLFSATEKVQGATIQDLVLAEEALIHDLSAHLLTRIPTATRGKRSR